MKVLFVCRANVGRSQAAMALYNLGHPGMANSAGTIVDSPGERLQDREGAQNIIAVLKEHGVDISEYTRTQIQEPMLNNYDRVIVMAEPDTVPEWLRSHPKSIMWEVPDPKGQSEETTRAIVAEIRHRVDSLHT